jgi:hypothetical protein
MNHPIYLKFFTLFTLELSTLVIVEVESADHAPVAKREKSKIVPAIIEMGALFFMGLSFTPEVSTA